MSRSSGSIIDDGQAALVIVGESKLEQAVDKAGLKADKHVAKELDVEREGHRQGRPGSRHRSQLTRRVPARAWPSRPARPNSATLEDT